MGFGWPELNGDAMRSVAMPDESQAPLGCGSKVALLLVLLIVIMIGGAVYWAWSDTPPDVGTPEGAATATPALPSGHPPERQ